MARKPLKRVVLDTSACIYFLDGAASDQRHRAMTGLFVRVQAGETSVMLSPVTVAELLVLPIRTGDIDAEVVVRLFVGKLCRVMAATSETASIAAGIRAASGLRLPDALILATAVEHNAEAVVGNHAAWKRVSPLPYIHLDDQTNDLL